MLADKTVLILSPNQLQCLGLQSILNERFFPKHIVILNAYESTLRRYAPDYLFLSSGIYLAHRSQFQTLKSRIILFTEYASADQADVFPAMLNIFASEEELIERLTALFLQYPATPHAGIATELTPRETDVLKLVARGHLNKHIADELSISLHTVISHRKNITQKLGIKTVAGLTVFALMHGLISSSDIE